MKELQRVVVVFCQDSNYEAMTAKDEESVLCDTFHGNNGKVSQLELLVKGSNQYLKLCDGLPHQSDFHPGLDVIVKPSLQKICDPNGGKRPLCTGTDHAINVQALQCSTRTGQLLNGG